MFQLTIDDDDNNVDVVLIYQRHLKLTNQLHNKTNSSRGGPVLFQQKTYECIDFRNKRTSIRFIN